MSGEEPRAPRPHMSPVDHAALALTLEVASTPKPGNVDRHRDHEDLRFEHFLAGAVGARSGLELAGTVGDDPPSLGDAFERAVRGMSQQSGGNTQFGCLLLLVPLVRAAATDRLSPDGLRGTTAATTVDDAAWRSTTLRPTPPTWTCAAVPTRCRRSATVASRSLT